MDKNNIRSFWWGRLLIIVVIVGMVGLLLYAWQFIEMSTSDPNYKVFDRFMAFRSVFMNGLLFYLALLFFAIGLWAYALFVDMNNTFRQFNYRPQEAMLYGILPVLNVYGVGWCLTRIIRVFEHEKLKFDYEAQIKQLKYAVVLFYGGLGGFVASLFFMLSIQLNDRMFFKKDFMLFNIIEFVLIMCIGAGLIWMVSEAGNIVKTGMKEKELDG